MACDAVPSCSCLGEVSEHSICIAPPLPSGSQLLADGGLARGPAFEQACRSRLPAGFGTSAEARKRGSGHATGRRGEINSPLLAAPEGHPSKCTASRKLPLEFRSIATIGR